MILTNEMNDNFANPFSESVGTLHSLQKSAIAYLFSDPRLELVKLSEREYIQGQIAYRSDNHQQEMMLGATLQAIEKYSQERYTILSIGCGSGLFEKPFVQKLIEAKKKIDFVGIDPNKEECDEITKWCQKRRQSQPEEFGFEIHPVDFDSFKSNGKFDIILLIQSLLYFAEIKTSIRQVYELLGEGGIALIVMPPRKQLLNEPFYYVNQRLCGQPPYSSEDLQKVLTECNIPFGQKRIEFLVNITECFQKESELGKQLFDFLIGANTAYLSPLQLRLLLDYFGTGSQKMESGEIMLPHYAELFYFEKMG